MKEYLQKYLQEGGMSEDMAGYLAEEIVSQTSKTILKVFELYGTEKFDEGYRLGMSHGADCEKGKILTTP